MFPFEVTVESPVLVPEEQNDVLKLDGLDRWSCSWYCCQEFFRFLNGRFLSSKYRTKLVLTNSNQKISEYSEKSILTSLIAPVSVKIYMSEKLHWSVFVEHGMSDIADNTLYGLLRDAIIREVVNAAGSESKLMCAGVETPDYDMFCYSEEFPYYVQIKGYAFFIDA